MNRAIRGAGGDGCFLGHTPIRIPGGTCRLDELKPGDLVLAFDQFGATHESKVLAVHEHPDQQVVRFNIWGLGNLDATSNHWVLNQFNAFVEIGTLGPDDCIIDENGHLRPITSKFDFCKGTVYNLTVETYHTFIANGVRVHNAGLGLGRIQGAGGGGTKSSGGGVYQPKTAPDSINSSAYVRLIDLLGEGEIEGFPSAAGYSKGSAAYVTAAKKDIYLNGTPILRKGADVNNVSNADYNFRNVDLYMRFGTQNQTYVPGFDAVESETSVGIIVESGAPVTREIKNDNIDAVRVTIAFQALQEFKDNGDIVGRTVSYQIQVATLGGSYKTVVNQTVNGRSGDAFQKSHTVAVSGPFPVLIRVVRTTPSSGNAKVQDTFSWYSYTQLTYVKLSYPNSALVALQASAEDFTSIPARSYRIRGLKVSLPSNAAVDQATGRLIYSGVWDGTFKAQEWCSCPVWCLWDLLTNCRYGLGQHVHSKDLNKWTFYQASLYANQLVSDGRGGQEARFSCNVNIQSSQEAYKVINDMCSVFRAMPYWGSGSLVLAQDAPTDPTFLFTQANVSEDGFQYSAASQRARHTVAVVGYLDMDTQQVAYESVENQEAILKYGVVTAEVTAFACTSRSQANRIGRWLLYSEQFEAETVTFVAQLDAGAVVRPGHVIGVSDLLRSGVRRGGRIVSGTSTTITVDSADGTDMPVKANPKVFASLVNGIIESRPVASVVNGVITTSSAFSALPLPGGIFVYSNDEMKTTYWRVLSVQEQDKIGYAITAISYNSSKYDYIEKDYTLDTKIYAPIVKQAPLSPANISGQSVII